MSAQTFLASKNLSGEGFLRFLVILLTLVLPGLFLIIGVVYYYQRASGPTQFVSTDMGAGLSTLSPSDILENKYAYKGQELTIYGRVDMEEAVCVRKKCPEEDSCCGCKLERNLVVRDASGRALGKTSWQLRLMGPRGTALCHRTANSCDYQCPGWTDLDAAYEIAGKFFADPPPRGSAWRVFLDFYFVPEEWHLVRQFGLTDKVKDIFSSIPELLQKIRGGSGYVIR